MSRSSRDREIATLQQRLDADASGVVKMNPEWRQQTERRLAALRGRSTGPAIRRTQWLALLSLLYGLGAMILLGVLDPYPLGLWWRLTGGIMLASLVYSSLLKRTARRLARTRIVDGGQ